MDLSVDESVINVLAHPTWKRIELLERDLRTLIYCLLIFFSLVRSTHSLTDALKQSDIIATTATSKLLQCHPILPFVWNDLHGKFSPQEHGLFH